MKTQDAIQVLLNLAINRRKLDVAWKHQSTKWRYTTSVCHASRIVAMSRQVAGNLLPSDARSELADLILSDPIFAAWIVERASLAASEEQLRYVESKTSTISSSVSVDSSETALVLDEDRSLAIAISADRFNILNRPFADLSITLLRQYLSTLSNQQTVVKERLRRAILVSGVWWNHVLAHMGEIINNTDKDEAYANWLALLRKGQQGPSMDVSTWFLQACLLACVVQQMEDLLKQELDYRNHPL